MSYDFLKHFDGTDKIPRQVQVDALNWVKERLLDSEILVLRAPVASGKSALSVAVQKLTKAPIITPSNLLINQYTGDYPNVNFLKGKVHYSCDDGLSCQDKVELLQEDYCTNCPYQKCKSIAVAGEPTFFNPLSYYYATLDEEWKQPFAVVVDEAHLLGGMLLLMAGKRFEQVRYDFDNRCEDPPYLKAWLSSQAGKLRRLLEMYKKQKKRDKITEITQDLQAMNFIYEGLVEEPDNYAIWIETGKYRNRPTKFLNVKPVKPPQHIARRILNARRVILMSGSIFTHDVEELLPGRRVATLDLPSPIPKEQRPIIFKPVPYKMNYQTPAADIAKSIMEVVNANPGLNTIIHVSYALSKQLAPLMPAGTIVNTQEDKDAKLAEFKERGGLFLAAGCAEGIDLRDDLCRLNIIPKLLYPNMQDAVVKKRMSLPDGDRWFNLETIKLLIQQAGRSTRNEKDHSKTYVLDPGALYRIKQYASELPRSFLEALVIGG